VVCWRGVRQARATVPSVLTLWRLKFRVDAWLFGRTQATSQAGMWHCVVMGSRLFLTSKCQWLAQCNARHECEYGLHTARVREAACCCEGHPVNR
jgi:hypothetical protein